MDYFEKFARPPYTGKTKFGKFWYFVWKEDSWESWIANIVLAFVFIKFVLYPVLGLIFGTSFPIVAVVSGSMHHDVNFDTYWETTGSFYENIGIAKEDFRKFPMHNGFNKGDIIFLKGTNAEKLRVGDILVFQSSRPDPIIHRVIRKNNFDGEYAFQTKGDNYLTNPGPIVSPGLNELEILPEQIRGKALIRVPYLGYVKILTVEGACLFKEFRFCIID